MKKNDRIIAALALLSATIIIIRVIGAMTGYDLIDMAVNAARPADANGWPVETH